jgi:uncharacterized protein with HEPN domain
MSPSAREYLQHILDETTYILTSAASLDKTKFVQDETLKRAYTPTGVEKQWYLQRINNPNTN